MGVLDVTQNGPSSDNSIIGFKYHSHAPYTVSYNANDEIRIPIQQQDVYTLPSESYLHLEYTVTGAANAAVAGTPCVSGFFSNVFSEICYEINGVEVDDIHNPGVTSLMKNAVTFERDEWTKMEGSGYKFSSTTGFADFAANGTNTTIIDVPLRYLLGFAEDYRQILLNVKQELVLTVSPNFHNCVNVAAANVAITKLLWRMPYVEVADDVKLCLLQIVQNNTPISISFRHWELYTYPTLPQTRKHTWTVKSTSQLEKPQYIVVGLQTARRGVAAANSSRFDKCNIKDVKVFLNSRYYPYKSIDGDDNHIYNMYAAFNGVYNHGKAHASNPLFESAIGDGKIMLFAFDCSRQNESLKTGSIDVRIEFEASENISGNTTAYCMMIHEMTRRVSANVRPCTVGIKKIYSQCIVINCSVELETMNEPVMTGYRGLFMEEGELSSHEGEDVVGCVIGGRPLMKDASTSTTGLNDSYSRGKEPVVRENKMERSHPNGKLF
ncbi:uncharacterized protein LOC111052500 [Nilaparvata lugens]|uniref:uncharacterized protein LOC111052500 n=1 Tax=Nilaparvata lugens TaxID=108931 RepID=UPI00193E4873|nr:uncharacterized protein LOC111052500 [Nilaparvata lugens]